MPKDNSLFFTTDNIEEALGTLGAFTAQVATTKIDASRGQGVFVPWVMMSLSLRGKTVGDGPIVWGVSNMSAAEIAERWIADPQNEASKGPLEEARRGYFKILGAFNASSAASLSDSSPTLYKLGVTVIEGALLRPFFLNSDDSALSTGTEVEGFAMWAQRWIRD